MTRVNKELPQLMALVFDRIRAELAHLTTDGVRVSHLRVVSAVPPQGASVTALADRLGMTKQGCGQFVAQLTTFGHLRTEPDPDDARVRRVVRTESGQQLADEVERTLSAVEDGFARRVGERRYTTFRRVLCDLATDVDRPPPS